MSVFQSSQFFFDKTLSDPIVHSLQNKQLAVMRIFLVSLSLWLCVVMSCLGYFNAHNVLIQEAQAADSGTKVSEIRINGVQRIEPETVLTYMDIPLLLQ